MTEKKRQLLLEMTRVIDDVTGETSAKANNEGNSVSENSNVTAGAEAGSKARKGIDYKWIALSNVTLASLMGTGQRQHHPDLAARDLQRHPARPYGPGRIQYLLWILMGFGLVTASCS